MAPSLQAQAPVNRLADETLSSIFRILSDETFTHVSYLKKDDWIFGTTHTCKRWRDVALGNPLLWAHFKYFTSKDLISTFIDRCKDLKISVSLCVPRQQNSADARVRAFQSATGKTLNLHFGFVLSFIILSRFALATSDSAMKCEMNRMILYYKGYNLSLILMSHKNDNNNIIANVLKSRYLIARKLVIK